MSDNTQIKVCTKKKLVAVQSKCSAVLTGGEDNKVAKVLGFLACPYIDGSEVGAAQASAHVSVRFDALVAYESGVLDFLSSTTIVKVSCENSAIKIGNVVEFSINVMDESSHINNGEVVCSAVISLEPHLFDREIAIKTIDPDDDVFTKESDIEVNSFKTSVTHPARATYEESKDGKLKNILQSHHRGIIKSVVPSNDYFIVSGDIVFGLIYECEDGAIKSFIKQTSFSEEVECMGLNKENIIQAKLIINVPCSARILQTGEGNGSLSFDLPYVITANVYERTNRECVIDAYHLEQEVNITTESYEQSIFLNSGCSEENIIASFTLGEASPRIEKILAVSGGNVSIVNSFVKDREVVLEGISNVNTIYYSEDDDGNKILNSVLVDAPYSLTLPCSEALLNDEVEAQIILSDVSVKSRKGRELEIIATVKVSYNLSRTTVSAVATGLSYGEVKQPKEFALEIYVVKEHQTIWDIAKHLNISTEDLLNQNPAISLPVVAGEKIVCYKKRHISF
jgi:hypothetical protein